MVFRDAVNTGGSLREHLSAFLSANKSPALSRRAYYQLKNRLSGLNVGCLLAFRALRHFKTDLLALLE